MSSGRWYVFEHGYKTYWLIQYYDSNRIFYNIGINRLGKWQSLTGEIQHFPKYMPAELFVVRATRLATLFWGKPDARA